MSHRASDFDPRVARSRERLREALLALTVERGWDGFSVQSLCARAGVGRSTFYVHFADREELLLSSFHSDHIVPLRAQRAEPLAFVQPLVEHVAAHRALYRSLAGSSCEPLVRGRFSAVVESIIERALTAHSPRTAPRTAALRFLTGAYCETLIHWAGQPSGPSAAELWPTLKQLSTAVFESASTAVLTK